jgi:hypothetical protein
MPLLTPFHLHGQIGQLPADALDPPAGLFALALVDLPLVDPLAGPSENRRDDLQIAHQLLAHRISRRRCVQLIAGFQKQRRLIEQALSQRRRAVAPGRVKLSGLARAPAMRSQGRGHLLTVFDVGARHRHQNLHGHVRGDLSFANLLLNRLREDLHERQPARDPAHVAIEPPAQLLQPPPEPLLELGQQPPLFERGLLFRQPQRALEQQRFGLAHRPDHGTDRVPAQSLERRDPLVAVDHQIPLRLLGGHHHDRGLLADFGQ